MKIAFLIQDFSLGGSTTVVYDLIRNAPKSDSIFLLLFFDIFDHRYNSIKSQSNVRIIYLHKNKTVDFKFLRLLKKTINEIEPNVISCHLSSVFYLSLVYKLKKSVVFHTIHNRPKKDLPFIYRWFLLPNIRKGYIKLISCGQSVKEESEKYYKVPITNIQNGIDTSDCSSEVSELTNEIVFLSIGRLTTVKAVDDVVKAFSLCRKTTNLGHLIICGYGPEEDNLKSLVEKECMKEHVSFFGKTNDVVSLYKKAHVFCLLSEREGSPIVLLESMKYGLCSIGTDVAGTRDLIQDGITGFLVKLHDYEAASKKMIYLIENKEKIQEMRKRALLEVINFDLSKMVNEYYNLFKKSFERK